MKNGGESGESCPDSERVAAYIDGSLTAAEQDCISMHLSGCRDCRGVWLETFEFMRRCKHQEQSQRKKRGRLLVTLVAIGAVLVMAAIYFFIS